MAVSKTPLGDRSACAVFHNTKQAATEMSNARIRRERLACTQESAVRIIDLIIPYIPFEGTGLEISVIPCYTATVKRDPLKINFLSTDAEKKARRSTVLVAGVFTIFVGLLSALGAGASYRASTRGVSVLNEFGNFFSFSELRRLVWNDDSSGGSDMFHTPDGLLNVLILGIGGEGHDGPLLTDTILLASFDPQNGKLGLVSIPRDLSYPLGDQKFEKINSVNAYEEMAHPGEGARRTADDFAKLFDTRIDRVVRVDFAGFEKFIDAMGGIDVDIAQSFTDYKFPTDDAGPDPYKWTTASFAKGVEHMDGKRALTYARSRHSLNNGEGSDFARSARQQTVIKAVKDRLLSIGTIGDPKKISDMWTAISDHIQTDFSAWDVLKLVPSAASVSKLTITTRVLSDDPGGELVDGNINGAFMLFPRKTDWSQIRAIVDDPFATSTRDAVPSVAAVPATAVVAGKPAVQETPKREVNIEIKNGTLRAGLAAQASSMLTKNGYTVMAYGNARQRNYEQTVIYDLTEGTKLDELVRLKNLLNANISELTSDNKILLPDGSTENVSASSAHFLIILGSSSISLSNPYVGTKTP